MRHGHSHRYRQTNHARSRNTYSHGVFEDVLAESQGDLLWLTAQRLHSLCHTQCYGTRFGTTCRRHHLVLHEVPYMLA